MPQTKISKAEIIEVALQKYMEEGIQSFTMKQLTELTGISTKTVYKLFGDKTALLKACLNTHYSRFFFELSELGESTDDEVTLFLKTIHRAIELEFEINPLFYRELNKYYPDLQNEVLGAQGRLPANLIDLIQRGKKSGLFLSNVNEQVFWIAFRQLYAGITREKLYGALSLSGSELMKHTVLLYIRGICTLSGLQKMRAYEQSLEGANQIDRK